MNFDVSIVVPHRNHVHLLPRLFDSILAQRGVNIEIIVVDDHSDEPCTEVLDAYRAKGLTITLLTHENRIYTRVARLNGIKAAKAPIIAFADADDTLVGTEILAKNISIMQKNNADLLHFRSYFAAQDSSFLRYFYLADPVAELLTGKSIFSAAFNKDLRGIVLWNKLYRKDVFAEFLDYAYESRVRRYNEDIYLVALYYMHTKKYIGSHDIGYAYFFEPKDRQDAAERAVYTYYMREELIPYMEKLGFSQEIQKDFSNKLDYYMSLCVGWLSLALEAEEGTSISDFTIKNILNDVDITSFLKVLLIGYQLNAKKIVKATRILRMGAVH